MKLSVIGLGYVGAVSLACLARDGHEVIGVDIDPVKLDLIREGRTPIVEEGMVELMEAVARSGRVHVTSDVSVAVQSSDLSFICVGTPSRPNGSQDLTAIERSAAQLGAALRSRPDYHVFVVRSTVAPGTVEELITPLLERESGKMAGRDFDVCFQPEFLREGSSIRDYDQPPFTVVGSSSPRATSIVREVFAKTPAPFVACTVRTAEMLKYACNTFHALKITFANETGRICQALGIDSHEVLDLLCRDTQLNISPAYLRPGFAYGGSCLPKDLRALRYLASRRDVDIPMLAEIERSNLAHLDHAFNTALATGCRHIGLIGLSFKSGTDDLRESPLVMLAERFIGKGLRVQIYDPDVSVARLVGANRRYIRDTIPHLDSLMCDDLPRLIADSQLLVVGLKTPPVVAALQAATRPDQVLLDLVNLPERAKLQGHYRGICW